MIGQYTWVAYLRNGMVIAEQHATGAYSVDVLREYDVAEIHLVPRFGAKQHALIRMIIAPGESWLKYWVRSFDVIGGTEYEHPVIDAIGLQSETYTRFFILPDGSITITTALDPV